jgi:hypothetical protein
MARINKIELNDWEIRDKLEWNSWFVCLNKCWENWQLDKRRFVLRLLLLKRGNERPRNWLFIIGLDLDPLILFKISQLLNAARPWLRPTRMYEEFWFDRRAASHPMITLSRKVLLTAPVECWTLLFIAVAVPQYVSVCCNSRDRCFLPIEHSTWTFWDNLKRQSCSKFPLDYL